MTIDAVLRIKRKRTEDPLKVLLTSEIEPAGKKRRIWQLSRSSDSRGIPIPVPSQAGTPTSHAGDLERAETSVPRFCVKKRKAAGMEPGSKKASQRIVDLELAMSGIVAVPLQTSLADNQILNAMLNEYMSSNDSTQTSISGSEEEYVYDIYYPSATTHAIDDATVAIRENYGLLEHFDLGTVETLVYDQVSEDDSQNYDSEDSNAEDWAGNDYPDEEEVDSSDESLEMVGSGDEDEHSFSWAEDEYKDD